MRKPYQIIIIKGKIPVKKNSYRYSGGGSYKPENVTDYEEAVADAVLEQGIKEMETVREQIKKVGGWGEYKISAIFNISTKGHSKKRDTDGLLTTVQDALENAGVFGDPEKNGDSNVGRYGEVIRNVSKTLNPEDEEAIVTIEVY